MAIGDIQLPNEEIVLIKNAGSGRDVSPSISPSSIDIDIGLISDDSFIPDSSFLSQLIPIVYVNMVSGILYIIYSNKKSVPNIPRARAFPMKL